MTKLDLDRLTRRTVCLALVVAAVLAGARAAARTQQPPPRTAEAASGAHAAPGAAGTLHVRGYDKTSAYLLARARLLSPTVERLVATLQTSDVIVAVKTGCLRVPGQLQLVGAASTVRYLCITLNGPGPEAELIAALAHELQHAVEVAAAREVTDDTWMARYYETHGQRSRRGAYCTHEATKITDVVRYELAANLGARR